MTVQDATPSRPSFGVWACLMETFSLLGRRPLLFFGFSIVVGLLLPALLIYLAGDVVALTGDGGEDSAETVGAILAIVAGIVMAVTQVLCLGVLTLGAYDASVGTRRSVGTYLGLAFRRLIKLLLVMIGLGILVGICYGIIVVLGLWMTAVYAAILPIVMGEGLGYAAFGRARALSKEYRWPIVGYLLLVGLLIIAIVLALAGVAIASGNNMAIVIAPLISFILAPLGTIAMSLGSVAIYGRLRAIKESHRGAEVADVFA